jgi:hypothetical protein
VVKQSIASCEHQHTGWFWFEPAPGEAREMEFVVFLRALPILHGLNGNFLVPAPGFGTEDPTV